MIHQPQHRDISIVTYQPEFREAFERLNLEWLNSYDLLEREDLPILHDPEYHVLRTGGELFFALLDDEVAGTCAAIRQSDHSFELAKLAVATSARRRGLGRRLSETAIAFARGAGAKRIVLTSNHKLREAIALYESLGFVNAPMPETIRYATADVYMTLDL